MIRQLERWGTVPASTNPVNGASLSANTVQTEEGVLKAATYLYDAHAGTASTLDHVMCVCVCVCVCVCACGVCVCLSVLTWLMKSYLIAGVLVYTLI